MTDDDDDDDDDDDADDDITFLSYNYIGKLFKDEYMKSFDKKEKLKKCCTCTTGTCLKCMCKQNNTYCDSICTSNCTNKVNRI